MGHGPRSRAAAGNTLGPLGDGSLSSFAYFPYGFPRDVEELSTLAIAEDWTNERGQLGLLSNYLVFSFKYITKTQPDKLKFSFDEAKTWAVYDTRLLSSFATGLLPIFALFQKNNRDGVQPYCFKGWCVGWGEVMSRTENWSNREVRMYGGTAPEPFSTEESTNAQPAWWKDFDSTLTVHANAPHILRDNIERLRGICTLAGAAKPSDEDIATKLTAALECAKRFAKLNPRRVLPQLFLPGGIKSDNGFVRQLLLPLHLCANPVADAALTIKLERDPDNVGEDGELGWMYTASTVLTLAMAFNNARLVNSVESPWLCQSLRLHEMQQANDLLAVENEDLALAAQAAHHHDA